MNERDIMAKLWESDRLYENATMFIHSLLRGDIIRLRDVPYEFRISVEEIYLGAIPTSLVKSCERYIEDLELMAEDIANMPEDRHIRGVRSMKDCLLVRMGKFLSLGYYDGVDKFELAKENIRKKLQI